MLGLAGASAPGAAAAPHQPVPAASVEGPITGGVRGGKPQNSTLVPVAPRGYVEEEFFVSGRATALPGASNDTSIPFTPVDIPSRDTGSVEPYTTRIIVRRPLDRSKFNGTLFVDWNNVTLQTDFDSLWGVSNDLLMREGYAYVAVSAQKQGTDGSPAAAKGWDPVRYAKLSHPGDAFSYDMFAQATRALRTCGAEAACPLGGLKPTKVIATGASQSATFLGEFINRYHPAHVKVFDGYFPQVAPVTEIRDRLVPILWVNSESELSRGTSRSTPGPLYRYWEIAGAMHGDISQANYLLATLARDQSAPIPFPWSAVPYAGYDPERWEQYGEQERGGSCPQNYFPSRYAVNAAVIAIDTWVRGGRAPAVLPPFELDAGGNELRDENQNIRGGLRLPPMAVPIATYVGNECTLVGRMEQFDGAKLASLYPTHADYVAKMQAATDNAVATGIMLPEDATKLMGLVAASTIPEPSSGIPRL
jgi:Alpha/beta hydrolase domain